VPATDPRPSVPTRVWQGGAVTSRTDAFTEAAARVQAGGDPHAEADALVAQMTLEEKLGCLDGDAPFWPGLTDMGGGGGYYLHPWPAAVVERLGIPGIEFADGPRGCVIGDATAFPVSMARGATFDPDLEERIGDAIGAELRASGATFTGAVCMNLLRHPAWGRAQETYGEDPHHVGVMAAALTRGLQHHVMACLKHFALNSMENARFTVDVTVDERALHEVYLPHFERVAAEGVASVMSAYNSVNGEWCGQNTTLLTDILRGEWGWDGFVVSDFIFGLRDAVESVRAGLDIEMPFRQQRAVALADAVVRGDLDVAAVDQSVGRIVSTLLRFAPQISGRPSPEVIGCDAHRTLAFDTAVRSAVLLRNDGGLLPVDPSTVGRVAVLGRLAGVRNLGDGGSSDVRSSSVVTPLDGLRVLFGDDRIVHHDTDASIAAGADLAVVVVGYTKDDEGEYMGADDMQALGAALFPPADHPELGVGAPMEPFAPTGRSHPTVTEDDRPSPIAETPAELVPMALGGDRVSLRLSDADEALIRAAAALCDRVVAVVVCGSAVVMPWADDVPAVLQSWYCGVEGGAALAALVTGASEPGGRLPFAVPRHEADLAFFDRNAVTIDYDLFHGQWLLDRDGVEAHFPFGWGLGYSPVEIAGASVIDGNRGVQVIARNDGDRATSAVVFVHAGVDGSAFSRPPRRLIGFTRLDLGPHETATAAIDLDWSLLDVRVDGSWVTEQGTYLVDVGLHAQDPRAQALRVERG
jgi:beta-glucosidase